MLSIEQKTLILNKYKEDSLTLDEALLLLKDEDEFLDFYDDDLFGDEEDDNGFYDNGFFMNPTLT